ncbi:bacillithiol system redox-active protein YtxJ [Phaeocystidibacter luteus]|uniref:Bacillithiol system redox-active protein YtxJ n=1 Tax=Phaeocystidibacter luteus TaxID=911197 RepID=A0A6N6RG77_9FLAO|nr:bacillithiol system redox-active protein YtxJ [Phaeocystidibacter luteus]KAB2807379.1 bacillithiol system redox-active protein YtxJ [Phaeocystidibacter luteus]
MKGVLPLTSVEELDKLDAHSNEGEGVLIYKHSTRCFISTMAERRLKDWDTGVLPIYYLDLLRYRDVSNEVSRRYGIQHQSPQLLWIKGGKCVEHTSHHGVSSEEIMDWMSHA